MVIYTIEEKKVDYSIHQKSLDPLFFNSVHICLLCILARKPCQKRHRML